MIILLFQILRKIFTNKGADDGVCRRGDTGITENDFPSGKKSGRGRPDGNDVSCCTVHPDRYQLKSLK